VIICSQRSPHRPCKAALEVGERKTGESPSGSRGRRRRHCRRPGWRACTSLRPEPSLLPLPTHPPQAGVSLLSRRRWGSPVLLLLCLRGRRERSVAAASSGEGSSPLIGGSPDLLQLRWGRRERSNGFRGKMLSSGGGTSLSRSTLSNEFSNFGTGYSTIGCYDPC
jgi:hypothetical protein